MLSVWDIAETRLGKNHTVFHEQLERLRFLSDGRLVSVSAATVRIWDTPTLGMKNEFHYPEIRDNCYEISPEGLLASADYSTINVLDLTTGASWQCPKIHGSGIALLKLGLNGLLASGSQDGLVCVRNIQTGKPLPQFDIHIGEVYFCDAFLNDDFLAMSEYGGQIFVWELSPGECHLLQGHTASATFALPQNGRFASCDRHGNVRIWSCTTWACEVALSGLLQYSTSERQLVLTHEQICLPERYLVYIQDVQTGERSEVWNLDLVDPIILAALKRDRLWCCEAVEGNWIKYGGQRLICLPDHGSLVDYPVHGNTLAVGYENGRMILIKFDPDKKPSAFASLRSSTSDLGENDNVTLS